jgi:hypothetical protein
VDPNLHADPGCLSRILIFSIPDPGSAPNNLSKLTQKIGSKLSEKLSRVVKTLIFTHPGSRGQKGTGSRIRKLQKFRFGSRSSGSATSKGALVSYSTILYQYLLPQAVEGEGDVLAHG